MADGGNRERLMENHIMFTEVKTTECRMSYNMLLTGSNWDGEKFLAVINIFKLTMARRITYMWEGSLAVTNPQKMICRVCSSIQPLLDHFSGFFVVGFFLLYSHQLSVFVPFLCSFEIQQTAVFFCLFNSSAFLCDP